MDNEKAFLDDYKYEHKRTTYIIREINENGCRHDYSVGTLMRICNTKTMEELFSSGTELFNNKGSVFYYVKVIESREEVLISSRRNGKK